MAPVTDPENSNGSDFFEKLAQNFCEVIICGGCPDRKPSYLKVRKELS